MNFRVPHSAPVVGEEEVEAAARVLRSGRLAQGPEVEAFEEECAGFVGRKFGVAVSSGTAALHLALAVLCPRGRVALPSYGCASLLTAVDLAEAEPLICDTRDDFNLNQAAVIGDAKAVILPHLFGARADGPASSGVLIEDIAQSIGGPTGREGVASIASFYATKLMTTGEGGMLLTDDEGLASAFRDLRDYDNRENYRPRYNYKLTEMQAAIGRVQLMRLPGFIIRRKEIAAQYNRAFEALPLTLPQGAGHVYFRYVVRTAQREALEAHLQSQGIEAKRPVFKPAHHYRPATCPESERAHAEALSVPIHPAMDDADVRRVVRALMRYFQ